MRRTRTWAAVLAILALAAASCGGGSSDDATDGAPDDATDDSAKADPDAVMRFMWGTPGGSNYDPQGYCRNIAARLEPEAFGSRTRPDLGTLRGLSRV